VRNPKKSDWSVGQVVSVDLPNVTVFFASGGERKISTNHVELTRVDGPEAESSVLDAKFAKEQPRRRRQFEGAEYFEGGRSTSRRKFIESLGGTCANWQWSWSLVNHAEKKIFFGAWQDRIEGNRALILTRDWIEYNGRKRPSWPESRENLRLVQEEGYTLHVYTMIRDPSRNPETEPAKIAAIRNDLTQARLVREDEEWYAVFD
jgi:hypothetical protein